MSVPSSLKETKNLGSGRLDCVQVYSYISHVTTVSSALPGCGAILRLAYSGKLYYQLFRTCKSCDFEHSWENFIRWVCLHLPDRPSYMLRIYMLCSAFTFSDVFVCITNRNHPDWLFSMDDNRDYFSISYYVNRFLVALKLLFSMS